MRFQTPDLTPHPHHVFQLLGSSGNASIQVIRPFAAGGSSELWEVHQTEQLKSRTCILKVLRASYVQSPLWRAMFAREIYLSRLLGGVVTPWALAEGLIDGRPCYTMARIKGINLRSVFRNLEDSSELFQCSDAATLIIRLLRAVMQLHAGVIWNGTRTEIIHRDLSPDNIMVTHDAGIRILDLGTALPLVPLVRERKNFAVGKERYMAPELREQGLADICGDIYAVGRIIEDILQRSAIAPLRLKQDIAALIRKCTTIYIFRRWHSAAAILRALLNTLRVHRIPLESADTCARLTMYANMQPKDQHVTNVGTRRLT